MDTFALSRHSLERLCQRGAGQYGRRFDRPAAKLLERHDIGFHDHQSPAEDGTSSWLVPVVASSGVTVYLPIVRNLASGGALFVAATALSESMIVYHDALEPLRALLAADGVPEKAELIAAFQASAKATRRGRAAAVVA